MQVVNPQVCRIAQNNGGQNELQDAGMRLQVMLDTIPLCVTMWNQNLDVIDCSQSFVDLLGFANKQDAMERILDTALLHQPNGKLSADVLVSELKKAFELGSGHFEFTHCNTSGEPIIFDIVVARVIYGDEYALMLYGRDIREEKRMLQEVEYQTNRFEEKNHRAKVILDEIALPVMITNVNMDVVFINKAAEEHLNITDAELAGKPCKTWSTPICATADCSVERFKRGLKQTPFQMNGRSYQVDTGVIHDLKGDEWGYVEVLNDITKIEQAARKQADAASAAKSAFLATMSHEMRTPLSAIIGMASIGRRSTDAERKDYALARIEESSEHLLEIVNDILDMSKIEANKLELSVMEFNIEHMLKKVMSVINNRTNEKHQEFSINLSSDVPRFIYGDDQRLTQIITNLLSNAVKFTPEYGKIRFDISRVNKSDDFCELRFDITDSGIGISREQQGRLFDVFSQAESGISREFGGTGLGLAISKRLVEMMDGEISVRSELGKGSCFSFTIKVKCSHKRLVSLLNDDASSGTINVMAVDASAQDRLHYKECFDQLGINCKVVPDCSQAKCLIETSDDYNIFIIDQQIPDTQSVELAQWIKGRQPQAFVVLTARCDWEALYESVLIAGADKGMVKPIFASSIVDCLNDLSANKQQGLHSKDSAEFRGKTLLLAEDVEVNREIVISMLDGTGLNIECAKNGKEALTIMQSNSEMYDIIFMDLQMPVIDGLEATKRIRSLDAPWCQDIPIVAMTANVFKDDVENCLAAGMNAHIGKPIDSDNVLGILRKYLQNKPRHQAKFLEATHN